ncbi:hypothetical protein [Prescottella sp. R16]|uniref:hypothetical protein n=1 Tax=Prescottella sp. R16 TaxID=3064529 RepID=UPI00272EAB2B|nr:hypothetical protein [Prescottella sp. R16]
MSAAQRRARLIAVLVAVVAVAGALLVLVSGGDDDASGSSGPAAEDVELTTAAGLSQLLDDVAAELGDSKVDNLTVFPDYAVFDRAVPGKPGRSESYRYEIEDGRGRTTRSGGDSSRTSAGVPVDLAALRPNVPTVIGLLYGADRTLGVTDPTDVHLSMKRDDNVGQVVTIYVQNRDIGAVGYLTVGFDGKVRDVDRADR